MTNIQTSRNFIKILKYLINNKKIIRRMAMGRIGLFGFGIILAVLCFLPLFGSATGQDSVQIFTNGSIYIDAEKKVDNLLVIDGVVKELNIRADKYKNATVIDLKGAAVYPGFIDSHVHLMETGYFFYVGANLIGCNDSASIAEDFCLA